MELEISDASIMLEKKKRKHSDEWHIQEAFEKVFFLFLFHLTSDHETLVFILFDESCCNHGFQICSERCSDTKSGDAISWR